MNYDRLQQISENIRGDLLTQQEETLAIAVACVRYLAENGDEGSFTSIQYILNTQQEVHDLLLRASGLVGAMVEAIHRKTGI